MSVLSLHHGPHREHPLGTALLALGMGLMAGVFAGQGALWALQAVASFVGGFGQWTGTLP
jgi:hypothetical protein